MTQHPQARDAAPAPASTKSIVTRNQARARRVATVEDVYGVHLTSTESPGAYNQTVNGLLYNSSYYDECVVFSRHYFTKHDVTYSTSRH